MKTLLITPQAFINNSILMSEIKELSIEYNLNTVIYDKSHNFSQVLNSVKPEIVLVGLEKVDSDVINSNPQFKLISKFGVGLDNIDLDALSAHNIKLGWTSGINKRSVSELILSFALGHCRNVFQSNDLMKQGIWRKDGGKLLSETQFGIVGFGNVGCDLANLLVSFGCKVVYNDILDKLTEAKKYNAEFMNYIDLLRTSDIISFSVPSTNLTKNMFNTEALDYTKSSAFIINTSRGDIVDLDVTLQAVKVGKLSGYASDVFPVEPYDSSLNKNYSNLIFTPHIGGNAKEAVIAMGRSAINHISHYLRQGEK